MKHTLGEIIVVFDSDWIPQKNFLKKILTPFEDPRVAIVQARQGIYNSETNAITRMAAFLLVVFHTVIMPINNKINCVFFCGTAGAIRRKPFEEVGGWNLNSLTEDSELSLKILMKGYKNIYLQFEVPSEVPDTFEGFIKQQMRWCYGNARVFIDNYQQILFKSNLGIRQKMMISFLTLGNAAAPFVILMTFFGFLSAFLGEPSLVGIENIKDMAAKFLLTSGFIFAGGLALYKQKKIKKIPALLVSVLTIGLMIGFASSVAFIRAILNKKLHWFCTPKTENNKYAS